MVDEEYRMRKYRKSDRYTDDDIDSERVFRAFREEVPEEELVEKVRAVSRQALPKLEEEEIEPLKRLSPEVVGSLFDRARFLKERIDETRSAMDLREKIHNDIMSDIDSDIEEKDRMESQLTNLDDKRNIKMDISILRREKRAENVRFWKDIFELRTELRELLENYQTETKILKIFEDLGGEK
jgi:hypothetical protein